MRVALMSYDERELRVRKFYLEEQSPTISCTCFQSGEPVLEALRKAMIEHVIRQHPQTGGDGLRVPADHRFGMAAFYQFLHLFRLMQADRNMLL